MAFVHGRFLRLTILENNTFATPFAASTLVYFDDFLLAIAAGLVIGRWARILFPAPFPALHAFLVHIASVAHELIFLKLFHPSVAFHRIRWIRLTIFRSSSVTNAFLTGSTFQSLGTFVHTSAVTNHCVVVLSIRNHVPVVAGGTGWSFPIAFKRGFAENFFGCMASWHQTWDGRMTIWDVTTLALCRVASALSLDKLRKLTFRAIFRFIFYFNWDLYPIVALDAGFAILFATKGSLKVDSFDPVTLLGIGLFGSALRWF